MTAEALPAQHETRNRTIGVALAAGGAALGGGLAYALVKVRRQRREIRAWPGISRCSSTGIKRTR